MPLIDPQLKAILVCPTCHSDLEEDETKGVLRCTNNGLEFPVRDGIPIMLVNEAGAVMSEAEAETMRQETLDEEAADSEM